MNSPAGLETRCKTCGKKIVFAMAGKKYIPLDMVAPVYALMEDGTAHRATGSIASPIAGYVGHYVSHFATCPQASEHSKTKKKERTDGQAQDGGEHDRTA